MGVEHRRNELQTTDLSVLIKARQVRICDVSDRIKSMHEQRPGILPIHPSIT